MEMIKAPWTQEQVDALNEFQTAGLCHPFTCGDNRTDNYHLDGEGVLVATVYGWACPYCDYEQDFAYDIMFKPLNYPPWHPKGKKSAKPADDCTSPEATSSPRD